MGQEPGGHKGIAYLLSTMSGVSPGKTWSWGDLISGGWSHLNGWEEDRTARQSTCVAVPCGQLPHTTAGSTGSAGSGFLCGAWALCTSVSTRVGQELQLLLWPRLSDLALSFTLHSSGYIQGTSQASEGRRACAMVDVVVGITFRNTICPKPQSQMTPLLGKRAHTLSSLAYYLHLS